MLRNDALLPRATHTIRPILRSRELRMRYRTRERRPAQKKKKNYTPTSREYEPESTVPLAGMLSKFYIPASGDFVFILVHGPVCGDAHKIFIPPLAGIRSGIDNSACGDAIKILHSRERRFCTAKRHIKIYIPPPSREYDPESTVPLAGMQSKFYIPQAEILYFGSWSSRAEMHINIFIPPSREYDLELTIPLAGMQSKYCIPANGASVTFSRRCT